MVDNCKKKKKRLTLLKLELEIYTHNVLSYLLLLPLSSRLKKIALIKNAHVLQDILLILFQKKK